jgi:hypothetical protein
LAIAGASLGPACIHSVVPAPLAPNPAQPVPTAPLPPTSPSRDLTGLSVDCGEHKALEEGIAKTLEVVGSSEFQTRLGALDGLAVGVNGGLMPGRDVLMAYLTHQSAVRYVPSDHGHETADTEITDAGIVTNFGAVNFPRWPPLQPAPERADVARRRACFVNTIAHEWTHTILKGTDEEFRDTDHLSSNVALVSYAVGSIAQCAYLERHKILASEHFWDCVNAAGTNAFNGLTVCEHDAWMKGWEPATPPAH